MQPLSRVIALALTLSFSQYILVGSGIGCRAPHGDTTALASTAALMSAHAAPEHDADCGSAPRGTSCATDSITCSAMALCGALVMTAAAPQAVASAGLTRERALAWFDSVPTRSIAPEPPPPRA